MPPSTQMTTSSSNFDVSTLSGADKTAILLLSLSEADAALILKKMDPKQVQMVGVTMANMQSFSQDKVVAVHRLFLDEIQNFSSIGLNNREFVRNALSQALGADRASNLIDQIVMGSDANGLESLKWMDARQVANIIVNEHPQIQTIVLSYLEPDQAARILDQFNERVRLDLIMRIANLEEVQPAALQELNDIMEKQFAGSAGTQGAKMGGLKTAADIMNYMDSSNEAMLMEQIRDQDEGMGQKIQDLMFVFENLSALDDRGLQIILREVTQEVLLPALKGADDTLRGKLLGNMSQRQAELLMDDLEVMGPIRLSEVEAAQKEILAIARRLADSGEIMLAGGGNDEFL